MFAAHNQANLDPNSNNIMNNPIALTNFNFNKNNNNQNIIANSAPQQTKNINPDNPEDILMDENFWNNLPNKKTENNLHTAANNPSQILNTNIINSNFNNLSNFNNNNNKNINNISNNQNNFIKNPAIDFNFNNSAAPNNRSIIPEFNFELPKQHAQVQFDASFNINNVHANNNNNNNVNNIHTNNNIANSNFNFNNNNNNNNNLNKANFSNFNINNFEKNLIRNNNNNNNTFIPNNPANLGGKLNDDLSRKQNSYDLNFSNLLQNDNFKLQEDDFDSNTIKKQIRGAIIVIKQIFI
jgi:hypothetical protein